MTEMDRASTEIMVDNDMDALQMAVLNFITRSGVAAVEMGIEELLEGHPLQEVWTRLLATRDITCVADLYGLGVTDLTAIRGFGPASVGDLISAVNDKQPWKFRLAASCLDIDAEQAQDDPEDERYEEMPTGGKPALADVIDDPDLLAALLDAGINEIDDLVIFTIGELSALEGVGEEGANLIMDKFDDLDLDLEMELDTGDKDQLVSELAAKRAEADALAAEIEEKRRQLDELTERFSDEDAEGDDDEVTLDSIAEKLSVVADEGPDAGEEVIEIDAFQAETEPVAEEEEEEPAAQEDISPDSLTCILSSIRHGQLLADLLADEGMNCADDLMGMSMSDLSSISGIGKSTAAEIVAALEEKGYAGYVSKGPAISDPLPTAVAADAEASLMPSVSSACASEPSFLSPAFPQPTGQGAYPQDTAPHETAVAEQTRTFDSLYPQQPPAPAEDRSQFNDLFPPANRQAGTPGFTSPMPSVEDPADKTTLLDDLMPKSGTWTPDGFMPDADVADSDEVEEEEDDEEEHAITTVRRSPGKGKIALFAGVGMVVVALALGCGLMLGGNIAHADDTVQPIEVEATVADAS